MRTYRRKVAALEESQVWATFRIAQRQDSRTYRLHPRFHHLVQRMDLATNDESLSVPRPADLSDD
ncbi:MAG: hypothetical protein P8P30_01925 [Rickettsiales bacterium]|nr:hypothetical protein [Rickettsiales bacterium]